MNTLRNYPEFRDHPLADMAAAEVSKRLEGYVQSTFLHELIARVAEERGVDVPDIHDEASFFDAAQLAFDFRNGKAREDVSVADLSEGTKQQLHELIDAFAMRRETEPTEFAADMVFIPGAAGMVPANRLAYFAELEESGKLSTPNVVLIGSERPVNMVPNGIGLTEIDRAGLAGYSSGGTVAKTEFDIMRNTAASAYGIQDSDWETITGRDPEVPPQYQGEYRVAHTKVGAQDIFVVSAPMLDEDRISPNGTPRTRANTIDGYLLMMKLINPKKEDTLRAVVVTDAVFTPFQQIDAQKAFAPIGVEVETVGFTREHAGMSDDWPGGDAYYLQELLSTFRSTRFARDQLADTK